MPVRVGNLATAKYRFKKSEGGAWLPSFFRGGGLKDYTDHRICLHYGKELVEERGIKLVKPVWYVDPRATYDQLWAQDHRKACEALDRTPAGEKARKLLFSLLTASQRLTAERYGYFDLWLHHPNTGEVKKGFAPFKPVVFRLKRFYPNGNILMGFPEDIRGEGVTDRWFAYNLCVHPGQPYPNDDITATQLVTLLTDPDEFVKTANVTDRFTGELMRFTKMWAPPAKPKDLVLPFSR